MREWKVCNFHLVQKQCLRKEDTMNIRNIAELIILQCIEDLWNKKERFGSTDSFTGEGFSLCAGLAGMDLRDQGRLLNMVGISCSNTPE